MKVGSGTASERRGELAPEGAFLGVSALLFFGSAVATVHWYGAMSDFEGMPMPGGWTMSMAWMRPAEQSWLEAAPPFSRCGW